jgi:protein TonB
MGGVLGGVPGAPPPPPPPKKAAPTGPVRVGGQVAEANLIKKVQPVYPPLAKSARVSGTVEFSAVISKEGNIENLQLVRGHPLLVNAAKEAVLQWKYRPTMLNGQAVEVITSIIVNFTLSQ